MRRALHVSLCQAQFVGAVLSALVLVVTTYRWTTTPYDGIPTEDMLLPLVFAAIVTALLLVLASAIGALRRLRAPGRRVGPSVGVIAVVFSVAAVSAIPIRHSWDDGCNDHGGTLPLIVMPWVLLDRPESPVAYENTQTLVECSG
ncbi:MAG TPA: hypothetical protein VFZ89_14195 [Solirubrobacteraceae bacterium]